VHCECDSVMGKELVDADGGFNLVTVKAFGDGTKHYALAYAPNDLKSLFVNFYDADGTLLSRSEIWAQSGAELVYLLDAETLDDGNVIVAFSVYDNDDPYETHIYYIVLLSDGTYGSAVLAKTTETDDDVDYLGVGAFGDGTSAIYYRTDDANTDIQYIAIDDSYEITTSGTVIASDASVASLTVLALTNGKVALGYGVVSGTLGPGAVLGILSDATTFSTALFATALTAYRYVNIGETSTGNIIIASGQGDSDKDGYAIYEQDNTEVLGATLIGERANFAGYISRINTDEMLLMWGGFVGGASPRSVRMTKMTEAGELVGDIITVYTGDYVGIQNAVCGTPDNEYAVICWNEPVSHSEGLAYTQFIDGVTAYWGTPPGKPINPTPGDVATGIRLGLAKLSWESGS